MKIVQSFWSKPCRQTLAGLDLRATGGWKEWKYFLYSISLSCLKASDVYDEVELFTDNFGKLLLIDRIGLPYTRVVDELDCLNEYPSDLWALGKVYSYSRQTAPFLHLDSDVFIWKRFSQELESAPLVAQSIEYEHNYYKVILQDIEYIIHAPEIFRQIRIQGIHSSNAGILGGNRVDFMVKFARISLDLIESNRHNLLKIRNLGLFNVFFEQLLFHSLARQMNIDIHHLFGTNEANVSDVTKFFITPKDNSYIHTAGSATKLNDAIGHKIGTILRLEYPATYFRINSLLHNYLLE